MADLCAKLEHGYIESVVFCLDYYKIAGEEVGGGGVL
jgi:hypothetical protein